MAYLADPGGVFESDAHRRVLGHLPLPDDDPTEVGALVERVAPDDDTPFSDPSDEGDLEGVVEVLKDLEADGYASELKDGWKQTKKGLEALCAPVPERGDG